MELDLPPREQPARGGFPVTPRGLRKWLTELGSHEVREATRRFSEGLRTLNRLEIPARRRLHLMELMRPTTREILEHLARRIQAQALPLPDRSRRVFELHLDLLREVALGYEIVLVTDARRATRWRRRPLALAAERALALHGEIMLRSAQVYAPLHELFWRHVLGIHGRAEEAGVADRPVEDDALETLPQRRQSPGHMFRRLLLFAIAHTEGLQKGEAERIYRVLESWAGDSRLRDGDDATTDPDGTRFGIDLARPRAPTQWRLMGAGGGPSVRVLDAAPAAAAAEAMLARMPANHGRIGDSDHVGPVALQRLIDSWRQRGIRRTERAPRTESVEVEVTLPQIHGRLRAALRTADGADESGENEDPGAPRLALQTIDDVGADAGERYLTHPGHGLMNDVASAWDDVGRGRPMAPGYWAARDEAQRQATETPARPDQPAWVLGDISGTGFRLRWEGSGSSRATVGELVALRLPEADARWRVGIVRWMQFIDDTRFELGCHTLAMRTRVASVRREPANRNRRRRREQEHAEPALLLPGTRARGEPAWIIVPAHMFRAGEVVELDVDERTLRIRLVRESEESGAFAHFQVAPAPRRVRPDVGSGAGRTTDDSVYDSI